MTQENTAVLENPEVEEVQDFEEEVYEEDEDFNEEAEFAEEDAMYDDYDEAQTEFQEEFENGVLAELSLIEKEAEKHDTNGNQELPGMPELSDHELAVKKLIIGKQRERVLKEVLKRLKEDTIFHFKVAKERSSVSIDGHTVTYSHIEKDQIKIEMLK